MRTITFEQVAIGRQFWWNGSQWRKLDETSALTEAQHRIREFQTYERVDIP